MLGNGSCAGFLDPLSNSRACLLVRRAFQEFVDVDPVVSHFKRPHERVLCYMLAVGAHGRTGGPRRVFLPQPQMTAGNHHACGQSFEIPLPWRREGFVEIISKSLMSKMKFRSGVAKPPKFSRCASPQACTRNPVAGVRARSAAINAADPR